VLSGLIKAFGAVGGESVDPSQQARVLAEGMSEAINCVASGLLTAPLPIAALIAIAIRTRRAGAASAP
jgi:biopolymer transport protein ExbB/TolQ